MNLTEEQDLEGSIPSSRHSTLENVFLLSTLPIITALLVAISAKTFNTHNWEPRHVHKINLMSTFFFSALIQLIFELKSVSDVVDHFCWVFVWMKTFNLFSIILALVLLQLDRFIAVYLNLLYTTIANNRTTMLECVAGKIISLVLTIICYSLSSSPWSCIDINKTLSKSSASRVLAKILMFGVMFTASFCLFVSVYCYVVRKILEKRVHPTIELPELPTLSGICFVKDAIKYI